MHSHSRPPATTRVIAAHPDEAPWLPPGQAWNDRLTLLLESTGEGIFGIDNAGLCTFVNRAACELLGHGTEQVLGRNVHELIHHTHADGRHYPEAECSIFNAFRQGLPCRIDSEVLWRADGSSVQAEYSSFPVMDEGKVPSSFPVMDEGKVQGAVVRLVDVTERKRSEALLRQTHDELERRVDACTVELSGASSPTCGPASSTTGACGRHSNGRPRNSST